MAKNNDWKRQLEEIKRATEGRWIDILCQVCGFDRDILNGRHHPCPRCGGKDRFRLIDKAAGAVFCNGCFSTKNGDGFAAIQHFTGCTFRAAVGRVADAVGVEIDTKSVEDPAKHLTFRAVEDVANRCLDEWATDRDLPPGTLQGIGCLNGTYRGYNVAIWPVWGFKLRAEQPVGFAMKRSAGGGGLPVFGQPNDPPRMVPTKVTAGSKAGWIGPVELIEQAEVIWKVEGVSDLAAVWAAIPEELRGRHIVLTNAFGCGERPKKWMIELLKGKAVRVLHDADEPGDRGANQWAKSLAEGGAEVQIVRLPYTPAKSHGKDIRDWLSEGNSYGDLETLAADSEAVLVLADSVANYREIVSGGEDGEERIIKDPASFADIVENLQEVAGEWPRRVGESLFVHEPSGAIKYLRTADALFGWMRRQTSVSWLSSATGEFVMRGEFYQGLRQEAREHVAIEHDPHEPPIPNVYYACSWPDEGGDGRHLDEFVSFFAPETPQDNVLIKAMICTLFWGGEPGERPLFLLTADGRGHGKTKLATYASDLSGGHVAVSATEKIEQIQNRLVSEESCHKRAVLLDNVKTTKFSWAELEALVSCSSINGKRLYVGEMYRPNLLTWFVTLNGPNLSTDLSQRAIVIRLKRNEREGKNWGPQVAAYIRENRKKVVADCLAILAGPSNESRQWLRWDAWEHGVARRFDNPSSFLALALCRQKDIDGDALEARVLEDEIRLKLAARGFDPARENVFIPNRVFTDWWNAITSEKSSSVKIALRIKLFLDENQLDNLRKHRKESQRGYLWRGDEAPSLDWIQDLGDQQKRWD